MTKMYSKHRKCCKKFNQREIAHRQDEVELWFFHTALGIIATNTNAKFQVNQTGDDKVMLVNQTGDDKVMLRTKNFSKNLLIQGQITQVVLV